MDKISCGASSYIDSENIVLNYSFTLNAQLRSFYRNIDRGSLYINSYLLRRDKVKFYQLFH